MLHSTHLSRWVLSLAFIAPVAALAAQPESTTRAQVNQERRAFDANPVSADGFRWVGGEVGWARPLSLANPANAGSSSVARNTVQPGSPSSECKQACAKGMHGMDMQGMDMGS